MLRVARLLSDDRLLETGMNPLKSPVCLVMGAMLVAAAADAGCNCNKGGGAVFAAPGYGPQAMPQYKHRNAGPMYGSDAPIVMPAADPCSAVIGAGPVYSGVMGGTIAPPPGTLGQTYQRSSRPVPADKHPRAGMLDVRAPGATDVVVYDVENFRSEDRVDGFRNQDDAAMWHFESRPLIPGLPHIYRVVVRRGPGSNFEEKYVRLIMGRVVSVEF